MRASRRRKLLAVALTLFFLPSALNGRSSAAGIAPVQREILIVTPDALDGRLDATRDAIGFWNDTLDRKSVV